MAFYAVFETHDGSNWSRELRESMESLFGVRPGVPHRVGEFHDRRSDAREAARELRLVNFGCRRSGEVRVEVVRMGFDGSGRLVRL